MKFGQQQVRKLIEKSPGFCPMYTRNGTWKHEGATWTHWCDGFLPGMMWVFRRYEADRKGPDADFWKQNAIRYSRPLEARKTDREVHDLGFLFLSTYYRWFQVDRDPEQDAVLIEAGKTLALRFQDKGQYLRSFVSEDSLFIDIMMNVGIIFYAARATGDKHLREVALRHAHHVAAAPTAGPAAASANERFRKDRHFRQVLRQSGFGSSSKHHRHFSVVLSVRMSSTTDHA